MECGDGPCRAKLLRRESLGEDCFLSSFCPSDGSAAHSLSCGRSSSQQQNERRTRHAA